MSPSRHLERGKRETERSSANIPSRLKQQSIQKGEEFHSLTETLIQGETYHIEQMPPAVYALPFHLPSCTMPYCRSSKQGKLTFGNRWRVRSIWILEALPRDRASTNYTASTPRQADVSSGVWRWKSRLLRLERRFDVRG
jgi:hypothetical protein